MKKKQIIATGVFLIGTVVAACSSGSSTTATEATPAPATPTMAAAVEAATEEPASSDVTDTESVTSTAEDATPDIVAAADAFLATLSAEEQDAVLFDWTDAEQKQRWSNLPEGGYERDGLMWGNMSEAQQNAWLALMQVTLSEDGYNQVIAEWQADDALTNGGGGGAPSGDEEFQPGNGGTPPGDGNSQSGSSGPGALLYGTEYYWVALIGTPSETDPWMWQWGGHHVTVIATVVGSNLSLTPSFIGVQPATYTDADGNTVRPLGEIEDDAFTLINMLDASQQETAILSDTYIDLVLGPGQDGRTIESEGLPASEMTAEQQQALLALIEHYTGLANDEDAATRMAEIESTLDETYLAWYGPTAAGSAAYFRITGPTLVIEYSPQSMGGDAAAHIHGIYRNPVNDYGVAFTE